MFFKSKLYYKFAAAFIVQAGRIMSDRRKHTVMAAERNKQPILDVMTKYIDRQKPQFALEIASGTGQHVCFLAKFFPNVTWQPTEVEPALMDSIDAYIEESGDKNVKRPLQVDVTQSAEKWICRLEPESCDFILCINMIHITPFKCTEGLFKAAGYLLKPKGMLITYGPYSIHGTLVPESNVNFDRHLKSMNMEFGIHDIDELSKLADENGLHLEIMEEMPANNHTLIFRKIKLG